MVYTVNYTDVATCWVEPVAQLNKTERATTHSLETVRQRLPWALKELHPDSGSEFLNDLAITWTKAHGIALSRSRPSKKNDNAFVEQKNRSVVREYVGYERYDCQEAVVVINELYAVLRLYINFFQPVYKLQGKEKRVYKADCQPPQILNTQFLLNHVFRAATRGSQRKLQMAHKPPSHTNESTIRQPRPMPEPYNERTYRKQSNKRSDNSTKH